MVRRHHPDYMIDVLLTRVGLHFLQRPLPQTERFDKEFHKVAAGVVADPRQAPRQGVRQADVLQDSLPRDQSQGSRSAPG
eukprot:3523186-Lingulodinium_polyedra.AAC.1